MDFNRKIEIVKIGLAVLLVIFGCVLLMMGFWVSPIGVVDNSILVGFGETLTFSGAILGINYLYQNKHRQFTEEVNKKIEEKLKNNNNV